VLQYAESNKRFGNAFNQQFILFTSVGLDITFDKCSERCSSFASCRGVFWYVTKDGVIKCRGLSDIGAAAATSIQVHKSYTRVNTLTSVTTLPKQVVPTHANQTTQQPHTYDGFVRVFAHDSKRVLSTAKKPKHKTFRTTGVTIDECYAACKRSKKRCIAFCWWETADSPKLPGNRPGEHDHYHT
jgi:hypothetical protein